MFRIYMLSPVSHKSMENEQKNLGRATNRYLNTNGRWSGFPPKKSNRLLYWLSQKEAQKAVNIAKHFGREVEVSFVVFSDKKTKNRMMQYHDDYADCLKGYVELIA